MLLKLLGFDWLGYGCFLCSGDWLVLLLFCMIYVYFVWVECYFVEFYYWVDLWLCCIFEFGLLVLWMLDELENEV